METTHMVNQKRPATPQSRRSLGRYAFRGGQAVPPPDAAMPANGIASPPRTRNISVAIGAVPDPFDHRARVLATINRRTDLLELERSKGLISEAAYRTGRTLQLAFEKASRIGPGGQWTERERVDGATRHEDMIGYGLEDAQKIRALMRRVERAVGVVGARFLRQIIGDRITYSRYAAARGRGSERGAAQIAAHFRILLENLADEWATKGRG
jgi:hypothetical protein